MAINIIPNITYLTAIIVFAAGLYIVQTSSNYFRRMIGLGLFQTGVLIFYIALAKIHNGIPPIILQLNENDLAKVTLSNPLPHVLMLTAIVVGLATLSVGLALILRIIGHFNTADIAYIEHYIINEPISASESSVENSIIVRETYDI